MVLSNGTSRFASYSAFRISDEWSQYSLVETGNFHGNIDLPCPPNMIFGCSSQLFCDYPSGVKSRNDDCTGETEVCVCLSGFLMKDGNCVHPTECGCYLTETDSVLQDMGRFVNIDCSKKCTCTNGTLRCNSNYMCDSNAACRVQDGI
ncbi:Zonadhesin [Holothuria leucospilota]|uniref:Zonadhesin n=1 Tax=Holothuria leucospilota TaxID=206669 RepID=A0A9Q1B944_HOLLE|nr:Zonadhesin [Holothuria leucospilota]